MGMSERLNKTSICSVVCLDIVDQSRKPVAEQILDKELFNSFVNEVIKDIALTDRIQVDTGNGGAIALLGAPEEALFVAMTIRDSIVKHNKENERQLFVRTGINLGPVRLVSDISGSTSIQGDGINGAELVMSFAEPNHILVSRPYYEITSRLTDEIANMFSYSGVRLDRHAREHEVYLVRPAEEVPFVPEASETAVPASLLSRLVDDENSRYGLWGSIALVLIAIAAGGFMLLNNMLAPDLADVIVKTAPTDKVATTPSPVTTPQGVVTQAVVADTNVGAPNLIDPADPTTEDAMVGGQVADDAETVVHTSGRKSSNRKKKEGSTLDTVEAVDTTQQAELHEPIETVATVETADPVNTVEPAAEPAKPKEKPTVAAGPPVESRTIRTDPQTRQPPDLKAGWEAFKKSFKQGRKERVCTQAEIALNQCN